MFLCFQSMTFNLKKDSNEKTGKSCSRLVLPALTDPPLSMSPALQLQRHAGPSALHGDQPCCLPTAVSGRARRGAHPRGADRPLGALEGARQVSAWGEGVADQLQTCLSSGSVQPASSPPLPCQQGLCTRVPRSRVQGPTLPWAPCLHPSSQGSVPQVGAGRGSQAVG